ncbi:YopX family protein [Bacteroides salyersiae]|jgi:uncharacterized phage protein (TIGR01671 family)|nr:YopX family protein [Bacteroides salyersiae]
MNEIKFRAKNLKGEWEYGYYLEFELCDGEGRCSYIKKDGCQPIKVLKETVGQFTGLLDRNGKEIYEGDIVELDYITTTGKHRIGLSFEIKWCTQEGCWVGWDGFAENTIQQTHKMFVVKGNIYDNPELINE